MEVMEEKLEIVLQENDFINGNISMFAISKHLQDIASSHAYNLGVGYEKLLEKNLYWVLSKLRIDVLKNPKVNDKLTLITWPHDGARVDCHREFAFINENKEIVIKALEKWLTIDTHTYHIIPAKNIVFPGIYKKESNYLNPKDVFEKIDILEEGNKLSTYQIQAIDIDGNNHTNNTRYLLMSEKYLPSSINSLQIDFVNQSFINETITIYKENDIIYGKCNDKIIYKIKTK